MGYDASMDDVADLLTSQVEAWNRGDIAAFAAGYTEDASYLGSDGLVTGRLAIAERYERAYPDRAAMGTLALTLVELVVGTELAHALVRWSVGHAGGHALLGFVRTPEGWRVRFDATR